MTEFIFDNGLAVDLDVDGEFESTGLIDYINCSSRLTLENDGSYSFQKIIINQPIEVDDNNEITLPVQLFPVECEIFNEFGTWSEGGVSGEIISINSEANQQTGFNEFLTVEDINTIKLDLNSAFMYVKFDDGADGWNSFVVGSFRGTYTRI